VCTRYKSECELIKPLKSTTSISNELSRVEHIAIELDPSLTKRGKPRKDSQRAQVESIQPEHQRPAELAEVLLDLPARPGGPTFIACGRFYLTPGQQEEASFLNDDPVTATSPLPDILLRDPQEDPIPPISEDLTSVRLSSETTSLLQEIWVTKQRTNRQLLVKKAYRWMVMEEQEQQQRQEQDQIATRTGRISKPTQKRALNRAQGHTHSKKIRN
jgi:hypothetical protein